ncbi:MAG: hypothetical protein J6N72_00650 [Psychrobacter sp.]|nr:hypothetical protein [Psychrobacter sp.]
MNAKKTKNQEISCISATIIALLFCLYTIGVNLAGIKEARAASIDKKPPDVAIVDSGITVTSADKNDTLDDLTSDEPAIEINMAIEPDLQGYQPITLKKTVVLLDTFDTKFGEVCFEAIDDSVFMSYGWVGLAEKALIQTGEDKKIDDIKMELIDNCEKSAGLPILLSYNPVIPSNDQKDF